MPFPRTSVTASLSAVLIAAAALVPIPAAAADDPGVTITPDGATLTFATPTTVVPVPADAVEVSGWAIGGNGGGSGNRWSESSPGGQGGRVGFRLPASGLTGVQVTPGIDGAPAVDTVAGPGKVTGPAAVRGSVSGSGSAGNTSYPGFAGGAGGSAAVVVALGGTAPSLLAVGPGGGGAGGAGGEIDEYTMLPRKAGQYFTPGKGGSFNPLEWDFGFSGAPVKIGSKTIPGGPGGVIFATNPDAPYGFSVRRAGGGGGGGGHYPGGGGGLGGLDWDTHRHQGASSGAGGGAAGVAWAAMDEFGTQTSAHQTSAGRADVSVQLQWVFSTGFALDPRDDVLVGRADTLTARLAPSSGTVTYAPGTYRVYDGTTLLSTTTTAGEATTVLPLSPLASGRHELTVAFEPKDKRRFTPSSRQLTVFAAEVPTTATRLTATADGDVVTVTASSLARRTGEVTDAPVTIRAMVGSEPHSADPVVATGTGTATATLTALASGTHSYYADSAETATLAPSRSDVVTATVGVARGAASEPRALAPPPLLDLDTTDEDTVSYATTDALSEAPGTWTFAVDGTVVATADTLTTSGAIDEPAPGEHEFTATFTPDAGDPVTLTRAFVIEADATATTVTLSSDDASSTDTLTLRALVAAVDEIADAPEGTVDFLDQDGGLIGSAPVRSGAAELATDAVAVGTTSVTARFTPTVLDGHDLDGDGRDDLERTATAESSSAPAALTLTARQAHLTVTSVTDAYGTATAVATVCTSDGVVPGGLVTFVDASGETVYAAARENVDDACERYTATVPLGAVTATLRDSPDYAEASAQAVSSAPAPSPAAAPAPSPVGSLADTGAADLRLPLVVGFLLLLAGVIVRRLSVRS